MCNYRNLNADVVCEGGSEDGCGRKCQCAYDADVNANMACGCEGECECAYECDWECKCAIAMSIWT